MTSTVTETVNDSAKAPSNACAPLRGSRATIIATDQEVACCVATHLIQIGRKTECIVSALDDLTASGLKSIDSVVYLPSLRKNGTVPDVAEAAQVLSLCG